MQMLRNYKYFLTACSILSWLVLHSCLTLAELNSKPTDSFISQKNTSSKQLYLAGLQYDGANNLGYFWPQLFSDKKSSRLWANMGLFFTPSVGIGYRQLFRPAHLKQPYFLGVYGYIELPNWLVNPLSLICIDPLIAVEQEPLSSQLEELISYTRGNIGFEASLGSCAVTANGYAFVRKDYGRDEIDVLEKEAHGLSVRFAYHGTPIKPLFVIAWSYLKEDAQYEWLTTWAAGMRYDLTPTVECEIKYVSDFEKQHHFPVHFGFHYNPSAFAQDSKALPAAYNRLPDRFIPHYQNADIRQALYDAYAERWH